MGVVGRMSDRRRLFFSIDEMMEPFYKKIAARHNDGQAEICVEVQPEHEIYKAHFPGHPITPGAMLIEIATDVVGEELGIAEDIKEVKNVKFLVPHYPLEHEQLCFSFAEGQNPADVTIKDGDILFAKMTLCF